MLFLGMFIVYLVLPGRAMVRGGRCVLVPSEGNVVPAVRAMAFLWDRHPATAEFA